MMGEQRNRKRRLAAYATCLLAAVAVAGVLAGCSSGGSSTASTSSTNSASTEVRVASLTGPTSIGLVKFKSDVADGTADVQNDYTFTMAGTADEIAPSLLQGDYDIALIPANLAATLYNKSNGGLTAIDVNTLGVLYVVTGDTSISSLSDLAGRTVYMTGKGTTPEYVMNYLLAENGLTDSVTLEFKTEATEVAAALTADPSAIGVLPQPYATSACAQNTQLSSVISLTDEWDALQASGSKLVTGVTVVRTAFLQEHPQVVEEFLAQQGASVNYVNENVADAAQMVEDQGIMKSAALAQKAIPQCNLVCLTGADMKDALSGYLSVLYNQDPTSVGGSLPGDDFYYSAEK